jgi:hypothetical protein
MAFDPNISPPVNVDALLAGNDNNTPVPVANNSRYSPTILKAIGIPSKSIPDVINSAPSSQQTVDQNQLPSPVKFIPGSMGSPNVIDNALSTFSKPAMDTDLPAGIQTKTDMTANAVNGMSKVLHTAVELWGNDLDNAPLPVLRLLRSFNTSQDINPMDMLRKGAGGFDGSMAVKALENLSSNKSLMGELSSLNAILSKPDVPTEIAKYLITKSANSINKAGLTVSPNNADGQNRLHIDILNNKDTQNLQQQSSFNPRPPVNVEELLKPTQT